MAAILVFFCLLENEPLLPRLRENILLNFEFKSEAKRANLQVNKRVFKWRPFLNNAYGGLYAFEKTPRISFGCKLVPVQYREYENSPLRQALVLRFIGRASFANIIKREAKSKRFAVTVGTQFLKYGAILNNFQRDYSRNKDFIYAEFNILSLRLSCQSYFGCVLGPVS